MSETAKVKSIVKLKKITALVISASDVLILYYFFPSKSTFGLNDILDRCPTQNRDCWALAKVCSYSHINGVCV